MKRKKLSRGQIQKVFLIRKFIETYEVNPSSATLAKELYQMSFKEFRITFAKEALRLTKASSVKSVITFLKREYENVIADAVEEGKDNVSLEGIELIRFRSEHSQKVKSYCRKKGLALD